MFTADHWLERPSILDAWGQHAQAPAICIHWPSLPDEISQLCKRLAGTLAEAA